MAAIEAAGPARVFLAVGSECCVCYDAFGKAAEGAVAAGGSGLEVARRLRLLQPAVTALR